MKINSNDLLELINISGYLAGQATALQQLNLNDNHQDTIDEIKDDADLINSKLSKILQDNLEDGENDNDDDEDLNGKEIDEDTKQFIEESIKALHSVGWK